MLGLQAYPTNAGLCNAIEQTHHSIKLDKHCSEWGASPALQMRFGGINNKH